jgi:hypothetical protein
MKKLKNNSQIMQYNNFIIIYERLGNDYNGNPKFKVQFINTDGLRKEYSVANNQYYNIVSYSIEKDIKQYIDTHKIENYMEGVE